MISAISWVPKGISKSVLAEVDPPTKEELDILKKEALEARGNDSEGDDEDMELDDKIAHALVAADAVGMSGNNFTSENKFGDLSDGLRVLDMEHYDEEDDGFDLFSSGLGGTYYPSNEMDPYLRNNNDSDSEEIENMTINADDSVIVCASNEDDVSHLEVWIYEEPTDDGPNMFVHHEIIISAFPLCTAWLDCPLKGGEKGNFIAVGSMEPSIEIWDLDIIDEVKPHIVLGGYVKKKKTGNMSSKKLKRDSHIGPVLGLAWNREFRNILASASADKLVKIWDVAVGKCETTMENHSDKVQAVAWNYHAPQILLSGSFDHSVVMKDVRKPSHSGFKWPVEADVESLEWDPHTEHSFVVSLEDGMVKGFDIRTASSDPEAGLKPCFTLHAHDKAVCTVSFNPAAPGLLATGSTDLMVKLWDLSDNQPKCVASRNPKVGGIFCVRFYEDNPYLLAIGGSKGTLDIWDTSTDNRIAQRFRNLINRRDKKPTTS